jgi:hypothetical protein
MFDYANTNLKDLACYIYDHLKENKIDVVLVGGACVSIYSENRYQSYDLDFVTYEDLKSIEKVLSKLGFKRNGRSFIHPDCPFFIDFVNPTVAIGNEAVHNFNLLKTSIGSLQLLTPTDCIKDRLTSYFHWNDRQAFDQALLVANDHKVDLNALMSWAYTEGHQIKCDEFMDELLQKSEGIKPYEDSAPFVQDDSKPQRDEPE